MKKIILIISLSFSLFIYGNSEISFSKEIKNIIPFNFYKNYNDSFLHNSFIKIYDILKSENIDISIDKKKMILMISHESIDNISIKSEYSLLEASFGYIDDKEARSINFYLNKNFIYKLKRFRLFNYPEGLTNALKKNTMLINGESVKGVQSLNQSKIPALMIREENGRLYACWNKNTISEETGRIKVSEIIEKYGKEILKDEEFMKKEIKNKYSNYLIKDEDDFLKYFVMDYPDKQLFTNIDFANLSIIKYLQYKKSNLIDIKKILSFFDKKNMKNNNFVKTNYGFKYLTKKVSIFNDDINDNHCSFILRSTILKSKDGEEIKLIYDFDGIKIIKITNDKETVEVQSEFNENGKIVKFIKIQNGKIIDNKIL